MIVSAIPFSGNKRKLWKQIEPLLPEGSDFIDLCCGGGTMALNATEKYLRVRAYDVMEPLIELHKAFQEDNFIKKVTAVSKGYPSDKEGYLRLRSDYNVESSPAKMLNLTLRSNSNMMRFNKTGAWNMTYGERNSYNLERMQIHHEACNRISFMKKDFREVVNELQYGNGQGFVVYIDSPYQNTTATYNESGAWTDQDDIDLLECVLTLHTAGFKLALSNVFENKGKVNTRWVEFCELHEDKFIVHHLNRSYNNCSFRKSTAKTDEVLIVSK